MVIKRDGKKVIFNPYNIQLAVNKAGGSDATQLLVSDAVTRECLSCGFETADKKYDNCPLCGGHMDFIQRITGYLVGSVDRWNDGKRAELDDRVSHTGEHTRMLGAKHLEGVTHYGNE